MATLTGSDELTLVADSAVLGDAAASCAVDVVSGDVDVLLLLKARHRRVGLPSACELTVAQGQIDVQAELDKLEKQRKRITADKVRRAGRACAGAHGARGRRVWRSAAATRSSTPRCLPTCSSATPRRFVHRCLRCGPG
jgi:hypothetical protein